MLICGQTANRPGEKSLPSCGYSVQSTNPSLQVVVDQGNRPLHQNSRVSVRCADKDSRKQVSVQVDWTVDDQLLGSEQSILVTVEQLGQQVIAKVTPRERQSYYGTALIRFSPVRLDESVKKLLVNVLEANGSRFPLAGMTYDHRSLGEDNTGILVTSSYVKLSRQGTSVKAKYSEVKYEVDTSGENRSMKVFLKNNRENLSFLDRQSASSGWLTLTLSLVSTNSRDLVVLSWKAFVLKQFIIDKNILDNLENSQISTANVDIHLQMSRLVSQHKSLLRENETLLVENTRLKKAAPLSPENTQALRQEVERLQSQLDKDKENQLLWGYLDDRQEVEREMHQMKREVDTWVEKDRQNTVDQARWARQKEELLKETEELKLCRERQDQFIRESMKGQNKESQRAITHYDTSFQLEQLQEKHKEVSQKVRYLSDENSRLKQMASANSTSAKDSVIRELQQQVSQLQNKGLNSIQQQQIQMQKTQIAQLEGQLAQKHQQEEDVYALENEQLQNRNKQLQRKIDSLMQEMFKEKGSENFNTAVTNLQLANKNITEENVRMHDQLREYQRKDPGTQSRRIKSIFGDK